MNRSVKAEFWRVVRACLHEFYGRTKGTAEKEVRDYRARLARLAYEQSKDPLAGEMIYHIEALTIAGEIAGKSTGDNWESYVQLLDRIRDAHTGRSESFLYQLVDGKRPPVASALVSARSAS